MDSEWPRNTQEDLVMLIKLRETGQAAFTASSYWSWFLFIPDKQYKIANSNYIICKIGICDETAVFKFYFHAWSEIAVLKFYFHAWTEEIIYLCLLSFITLWLDWSQSNLLALLLGEAQLCLVWCLVAQRKVRKSLSYLG